MCEHDFDSQDSSDLKLARDLLDSNFDSVERDGLMASSADGQVWMHEARGVSVPQDDLCWSSHEYELLWHATLPEVREKVELHVGEFDE